MCNRILKELAATIAPTLAYIYNLSLQTSVVPVDFKIARVTPVYKRKGTRTNVNNYRPISIIPTLGKILEKIVKDQLESYCNKLSLLSTFQHAYQKGKSTQTALHQIVDDILSNMDKGRVTAAVFLDLTKGFDTLSHKILLTKLYNFGVRSNKNKWFASYIANREQYVRCSNNNVSKNNYCSTGVPQGTILGPMLFLIYINSLPSFVSNGKCVLYADDTTLYCSGKTALEAQSNLQRALDSTKLWFKRNKLKINASKSRTMLFGRTFKISNASLKVYASNRVLIERCTHFNLLGLVLDEHLNWHEHINHLSKIVAPKLGLLKHLSYILPLNTLSHLYKSIIQPHIDYALTVFGNNIKYNSNFLQRLQNRAARIITHTYDYNTPSAFLIKNLKWMTVDNRYHYFVAVTTFKALMGLVPDTISDRFMLSSQQHNFNTRLSCSYSLSFPKPKTNNLKRTLCYSGATVWNSLPDYIKHSESLSAFKYSCKSHFT